MTVLDRLADPLRAGLDEARARRAALEEQLAAARNEETRVARALQALIGETPQAKGRRPKPSPHPGPSAELLDAIERFVAGAGPDGVTIRQVHAELGISHTSADRGVRVLRDQGRLRLVGQRGRAAAYGASLRAV